MTSIGTGQTRKSTKAYQSDEIDRLTHEYLAKGKKIQREDHRKTKAVDLHWRHYPKAAAEGVE